jgi:hypothetical protein
MKIDLWTIRIAVIMGALWGSSLMAQTPTSLPLTGVDAQFQEGRIQVTIQNSCRYWVLMRISPLENPESNLAKFKIRLPVGTQIVIGKSKGNEDNHIFTIKAGHAGQILDVCG